MWEEPPQGATLVLGGARSGKSRFAETLAEGAAGPLHYLATAQILDAEMRARVEEHRARRGPRWSTHEVPLDLPAALHDLDAPGGVILVDCLTLWLSNLILEGHDPQPSREALLDALARLRGRAVLVTNEVGLGIVPENALARRFRDEAGVLNQAVAAVCGHAVFVAAGLPLCLKST